MHIFALSLGADLAGTQIGMTNAINTFGGEGWHMRSCATMKNYIRYPGDMVWDQHRVQAQWDRADVVILSQSFAALDRLGPHPNIIIHHHGSKYRRRYEHLNALAAEHGALTAVSTLDLLQYAPEDAIWLPGPVDSHSLALRGAQSRTELRGGRGKTLYVGHAPTDREIKDTDAFEDAFRRLAKHHRVHKRMIERTDWQTCLRQKARCDIFYDQVQLGYGMNAVEAWAMGIPVIAGATADEYTLPKMRETFGGSLPFVNASAETIYDALVRMMDERERQLATVAGLSHVRKFHSYEAVASTIRNACRAVKERG